MVVVLETMLEEHFPGHIGRYSDSFDRRAFGDTFQAAGVPTVLFEAGGYPGDFDREVVRKIYFMALLKAFLSLANDDYENVNRDHYFLIPVNDEKYFDWIIRNVTIIDKEKSWVSDIGGRREFNGSKFGKGIIEEIGDLSQFYGYVDLDGTDAILIPGKTFIPTDNSIQSATELISQGFTNVLSTKPGPELPMEINQIKKEKTWSIKPGNPANLILQKGETIEKVVMNGFVMETSGQMPEGYFGISLD